MDFEFTKLTETLETGVKEVGENIEVTAAAFHEQFISKVIPTEGKFGEVVTFATEMIPGVAAFNSIREGDWQQAAIDVSLDVGMIVIGAVTAGTGAVAIASARTASKVAIKGTSEVVEAVAKNAIKESAETVTKTITRETTETVVQKSSKFLTDGTHMENGKLKASVMYETAEGYTYQTNKNGNISKVEGKLQLGEAPRDLYAQRKVGGDARLPKDDGGHIIGAQFLGSGKLDNLVPMDSQINRAGGKWYNIEKQWADALKENKEVKVKIEPQYKTSVNRPDSFKVKYEIDGERTKIIRILNKAGG